MKQSLRSSEWLLVGGLLTIMISLVMIAKINAYRAFSVPVSVEKETVLVTIDGAVRKPGVYPMLVGTSIEEVLRKARPKPFANLQTLPLKQVIEAPLHLHVEELTEITVFVCGEVCRASLSSVNVESSETPQNSCNLMAQPIEIVLPAGSRISDLKSKLSLTAEADIRFFRRRKVLKNGEKIDVPKKAIE